MNDSPDIKAEAAKMVLATAPPLIRNSLLSRQTFGENYNIKAEPVLTFGDSGLSVRRSELYEAVRTVLGGAPQAEVTDLAGCVWNLHIETGKEGQTLRFCLFW